MYITQKFFAHTALVSVASRRSNADYSRRQDLVLVKLFFVEHKLLCQSICQSKPVSASCCRNCKDAVGQILQGCPASMRCKK